MGLLNTYPALILPFLTSPLGVFLMRQFMMGIPDALIEAARIDGAGEFRIFARVVMPLCGPPLATLGILTFLGSWNNFLWPLVAAQSEEMYTLPVALSLYSTGRTPRSTAAARRIVLVITPIVLLFVLLQRYFIQSVADRRRQVASITRHNSIPPEFSPAKRHPLSPRPDLSVQLFSVREQLTADFPGTIATLAKIGLTRVEPFGMVDSADQLKAALTETGLAAPTSHQSLVYVELTKVLDVAADLGVGTVIHPFTPPADWTTRADVERVAEILNAAAEKGDRLRHPDWLPQSRLGTPSRAGRPVPRSRYCWIWSIRRWCWRSIPIGLQLAGRTFPLARRLGDRVSRCT